MSVLDDLYAAIEDDAALEALPQSIARACGARSISMQVGDADGSWRLDRVSYFTPEQMRVYAEIVGLDPWTRAGVEACHSRLTASLDEIVVPETLVHTEFYRRFIGDHGDDTNRQTELMALLGRLPRPNV